MRLVDFMEHVLVVAMAVGFLAHFGMIVKVGPVLIGEPSGVVLGLEISAFTVFVCFGALRLLGKL